MKLASFLKCMFLTVPLFSQTAFSILLEKTEQEMVYLFKVPLEEIISKNKEIAQDGFELIDLECFEEGCWGIWQKTDKPISISTSVSWEDFLQMKEQKAKDKQLLNDVEVFKSKDRVEKIIGLWRTDKLEYGIWVLSDFKKINFHYKSLSKVGLYLKDIEVIEDADGLTKYIALYHRGPAKAMTHMTQFSSNIAFNEDKTKRILSGYASTDIEIAQQMDMPLYLALYRKSDKEQFLSYQMRWESLLHFQDYLGPEYKIVDIELNNGISRSYISPMNVQRMTGTPDSDMKSIHLEPSRVEEAIRNQSIAFAAANAIFWLSNNGYDKLNISGDSLANQACLSIAKSLSSETYMKTMVPGKSSIYTIIDGLASFINQNYEIEDINYYSLDSFDLSKLRKEQLREKTKLQVNLDQIPLNETKKHFYGSCIFLIKWGLYQPSHDQKHLVKKQESWGTLVAYGQNEKGDRDPSMLIVHDPGDGSITREKFFSVTPIEEYFMTTNKSKLLIPENLWESTPTKYRPIPASNKQYLFFKNNKRDKTKKKNRNEKLEEAFAIWESLLVIRLK